MAAGVEANWPSIAEFYAGRHVLITGATGFMGKCLVEKLLRSAPNLGRIILLIRPKGGKTIQERLNGTLDSPVSQRRGHGRGTLSVCSEAHVRVYVRTCVVLVPGGRREGLSEACTVPSRYYKSLQSAASSLLHPRLSHAHCRARDATDGRVVGMTVAFNKLAWLGEASETATAEVVGARNTKPIVPFLGPPRLIVVKRPRNSPCHSLSK